MIVAMVPRVLSRSDLVILVGGGVAAVLAGVTRYAAATPAVLAFVTAAIAVALLASLVAPSIAAVVHAPAERHKTALSVAVSVVLLAVFALTLPASLRRHAEPAQPEPEQPAQPEPRRP